MTDFLGLGDCAGLPPRDEPPNVLEYTAAEEWVRVSYRRYFALNGGNPQLVTWGLDRLFVPIEVTDPVLELVMSILDTDYRNLFSNATIRKYTSMLSKGASAAAVNALLKEALIGGLRKPDILGISAWGDLIFDSVEVGTVRTAMSTWHELEEKMDILRIAVVPQVRVRLPERAARNARGFKSMSVPTNFVVRPSAFRLRASEMIMPLPVRISQENGQEVIDWICYHPSTHWRPDGSAPSGDTTARPGTDGLIIYHIHRTPLPKVPQSIRSAIEEELKRWQQSRGYILELNPALVSAFTFNKSAWSPEARALFTVLGISGLVLLLFGIGWGMGLFAGAAALGDLALTAAASSPANVLAAVRFGAALASDLWQVAAAAAPLVPMAAR